MKELSDPETARYLRTVVLAARAGCSTMRVCCSSAVWLCRRGRGVHRCADRLAPFSAPPMRAAIGSSLRTPPFCLTPVVLMEDMAPFDLGDPYDGQTAFTDQAEAFVRFIAADTGVPDFVYRPVIESYMKPGGKQSTEEVSDGVLMVGQMGLVIESKARDFGAALSDGPDDARRKLTQKAMQAIKDCNGSLDRLCEPGGIEMTSMRGNKRTVQATKQWPKVVILTHPNMPENVVIDEPAGFMFISLDDWIALHGFLRSTQSVIRYVHSVVKMAGPTPPLGQEASRYFAMAQRAHDDSGERRGAIPAFPLTPIAEDDLEAAAVVSQWIESVYRETMKLKSPNEYLEIVELLDRIPPTARVNVGRLFLSLREESLAGNSIRHNLICPADNLRTTVLMTQAVEGSTEGHRDEFGAKLVLTRFHGHG